MTLTKRDLALLDVLAQGRGFTMGPNDVPALLCGESDAARHFLAIPILSEMDHANLDQILGRALEFVIQSEGKTRGVPTKEHLSAIHVAEGLRKQLQEAQDRNLELAGKLDETRRTNAALCHDIEVAIAEKDKLEVDLAAMTKDRDQQKSYYTTASNRADEKEKELQRVHDMLDMLPGAPERTGKRPNSGYEYDRTVTERLMTWLLARVRITANPE